MTHLPKHDIAGYSLTAHAFRRAIQRRVDPDQIALAITDPETRVAQDRSGTKFQQSAAGVGVVIDVVSRQIITVVKEDS